jgi:hypothetical protein
MVNNLDLLSHSLLFPIMSQNYHRKSIKLIIFTVWYFSVFSLLLQIFDPKASNETLCKLLLACFFGVVGLSSWFLFPLPISIPICTILGIISLLYVIRKKINAKDLQRWASIFYNLISISSLILLIFYLIRNYMYLNSSTTLLVPRNEGPIILSKNFLLVLIVSSIIIPYYLRQSQSHLLQLVNIIIFFLFFNFQVYKWVKPMVLFPVLYKYSDSLQLNY